MERIFQIGGFCFSMTYPDEVTPPENFMRFECAQGKPVYRYTLSVAQAFPQPVGNLIARRPDLAVFADGELECRYIGMMGTPGFYACMRELDTGSTRIDIAPGILPMMDVDTIFLSMLAMERRQMALDSLLLHCAYMERGGEAILFSAPSETGKTTQATLWEKHRGTRVVNGDKSLLIEKDGRWTANGWPVCGSSGVCHNEGMPIRAIVMLSQGKTDTIERLTPFQAFSQIYSQMTINVWNRQAQKQAMDLIERLVTSTPVYHLSCTISEDAVRCLENALIADEMKQTAEE